MKKCLPLKPLEDSNIPSWLVSQSRGRCAMHNNFSRGTIAALRLWPDTTCPDSPLIALSAASPSSKVTRTEGTKMYLSWKSLSDLQIQKKIENRVQKISNGAEKMPKQNGIIYLEVFSITTNLLILTHELDLLSITWKRVNIYLAFLDW